MELTEKWAPIIESEVAPKVDSKPIMAQLLENEESYMLNEANVAADMAQYTPILVPAVRRIFPNLIANEIVSVQAMNAPTGYAYALRFAYAGTNADPTDGAQLTDLGTATRGNMGTQTFGSFAILATDPDFVFGSTAVVGAGTATVKYAEPGRALVTAAASAAALFTVGATGTSGGNGFTIVANFDNEAGFNLIFKNYFGPMSTATGETLGADMKNMKMKLERVAVEVQTRKLKAEYTLELAQDLKNVHGLDAEAELINILEYEVAAELDRELVDLMNKKATQSTTWTYGTVGDATGTADGRWEAEKLRTLYTKILRESNQIALQTRRGAANIIIASSNVVAALESLSGFMYASIPGNVKPTLGVAKVGTLDGRFTVYMDTFATEDYVTLAYKGSSAFDSGIIYCPYVPLMLQKVTDPVTFQPKLAFMTRDAIVGNMWGTEKYMRRFKVNFTGSSLGGVAYW